MSTDTEILIVGAGPTGLVAAALSARQGVAAITVSQHSGTAPTPRAHITNQRSVEIFRELGLEEDLHRVATPIRALGNNVWATSFAGTELARMHAWGTGPDRRGEYAATSPCEIVNAPQHVLEPVLLNGARKAGADIRFDTEVTAISQDDTHVHATVQDHATGQQHTIRARYLIGADGGRSLVAQQAGITYEDDTGVLNRAVSVWLEADLTEHCAHRPAALYWIHRPGDGLYCTTWMCVQPWDEWVMTLVYPPDHADADTDPTVALEQAHAMIADPAVEVRIKLISHWSVGTALASQFRRGWIFLAGDSAHRHPPPNGLGSNTGMQDAYNLCWKLAMVLRGQAGDRLLDSYDTERKPVARTAIETVFASLGNLEALARAFGLAPDQTTAEAIAQITELGEPGPRGQRRRRALRDAVELQNYQYNCHGVESGHPYTAGAIATQQGASESGSSPSGDAALHHQPTTRPGAHLPHAWIEHHAQPLSTVDLAGEHGFTLITGVDGHRWSDVAARVSDDVAVPITVAVVGYQQQYHDVYGTWAELCGIDDSGCLLVRPDRRIAWRAPRIPADPYHDLTAVIRHVLGKEHHEHERT